MATSHLGSAKSGSSVGSVGSRKSQTPPSSAGRVTSSKSSGRVSRPSDKLNPKTIDPFGASSRNQSAFAAIYSNGGVPCRLVHGSVSHKLAWNPPPEHVPFDPIVITLAEGLKENIHPYMFVARTGFKELLEIPDAADRVMPLVPKVTAAMRGALAHSDPGVFSGGLDALVQLSDVIGPQLNPHLGKLLVPVAKRISEKKHREKVVTCLQTIEENGGRECTSVIKSKIPTYSSIFG